MGVVVHVGELGRVHMHLQTAFDALEAGDGRLYGFRVNPIAQGHGGCGDAVLAVYPAGCAHLEAGDNAVGCMQVVVEAAAGVRLGADRIKIGRCVRIMVGVHLGLGIGRAHRDAFLGNEDAADLRGKGLEGFHHMRIVAVNVQVVGVYGGNHGNLREQLEEGAVEFIGLRHNGGVLRHEEIGAVVAGDAAQERTAALSAVGEDMGDEGRCGGFSVRTGNGQAALSLGNLAQGTGTLEKEVAFLAGFHQLSQIGGNGGRVHHQGLVFVLRKELRLILVMHVNALSLQREGEVGGGPVITGHVVPLELVVAGKRTHADAANSYKVNVLHYTNL